MEPINLISNTTSLVAKRNSGKSILLKYLVDCQKHEFDKIFVICPTETINRFYSSIVPSSCIMDEWNEAWAEELIQRMTKVNAGVPAEKRKNVLLILDDVFADMNSMSPALKRVYLRGRHCGLGLICTCQYLYNLPPVCRNNCDHCIVGQMNRQSVGLLSDEYLSGDLDKKDFIKLYNRSTKDYQFLVINCNSIKDSDDLNQIYGIVKTPEEYV